MPFSDLWSLHMIRCRAYARQLQLQNSRRIKSGNKSKGFYFDCVGEVKKLVFVWPTCNLQAGFYFNVHGRRVSEKFGRWLFCLVPPYHTLGTGLCPCSQSSLSPAKNFLHTKNIIVTSQGAEKKGQKEGSGKKGQRQRESERDFLCPQCS